MKKRPAVPQAKQGGGFVIACAPAGVHGIARVGANGNIKQIIFVVMCIRDGKSICRGKFVVGKQRWGVAGNTALFGKNAFSFFAKGIGFVGIGRRF